MHRDYSPNLRPFSLSSLLRKKTRRAISSLQHVAVLFRTRYGRGGDLPHRQAVSRPTLWYRGAIALRHALGDRTLPG